MRLHIPIGGLAVVFGAVTVLSGASVLWGPPELRAAAGDIVYPILWFNLLSGPAYMVAGAGIVLRRSWARALSRLIAAVIAAMLAVLVGLILAGNPWEPRTLAAMTVRLAFWLGAARVAATSQSDAG